MTLSISHNRFILEINGLWLSRERVDIREFGMDIHTAVFKMDNQQTCYTVNSAQCYVCPGGGARMDRRMYLSRISFTNYLKSITHC